MKPPIGYFGGKGSVAQQIVALMPEHRGYIEPFAGSLAVLLEKDPVKLEVVNDLDERIVTFWRVLRDRPGDLAAVADLTPHSRVELERAMPLAGDDELELARQVWVLLTQGRARTLKRTGWRFFTNAGPGGTSASFAQYMDAYRSRLLPAAERIHDVVLECRPALEVIESYGAVESNLLYVDPPYLASTRSAGRYAFEMASESDHRDLATALRKTEATVLLSGYASELYVELYDGWHRHDIGARSDNAADSTRTEVIWSNRPLGGFLFDLFEGAS